MRLRQLRDCADVAGSDLRRMLLALAHDVVDGTDALGGVPVRVPHLRVRLESAGEDAEVRQTAHVWVSGSLEYERRERLRRVSGELFAIHGDGGLGRGRKERCDRIEKAPRTDRLGGGAGEDGDDAAGGDAGAHAVRQLFRG